MEFGMKKILGIVGSPRKLGNCEIMVKEISRRIDVPHTLQLLRLSDFHLLPCKGCYRCLSGEDPCVLDDDLETMLHALVEADALIVAAPTYFLSANAGLKQLLDRGITFYRYTEALWGKPAIGVGIAGIPGREGYTQLSLENFLKLALSDIKRCEIIYGALPGEIFLDEQNRKSARDLAEALFAPSRKSVEPCCPLCGGQTFRFLDSRRIRCMLCSNEGMMTLQGGTPRFEIKKSEGDLFLSKEEVLAHQEWLLGMKDRFIKNKQQLKEICLSYRKEGEWIKPK